MGMIKFIPFFIGELKKMEELYTVIRRMTSDSRMIALNTATPQYKVNQLKSKLFLVADNQNRDTCEWWLRLYRGEFSKDDIKRLLRAIEQIK